MADEFKDLEFPKSGIDTSLEFDMQRNLSTREAENVRLYEPGTGRARGGARAGLGRYIDSTVNGAHLVQHLAVIVDPTVEGLLADLDDEGPLTDPSTSNRRRRLPTDPPRKMRRGGNANSPTRKTPRKTITITANDQTKTQGTLFTFDGTEFTVSGIEALDSVDLATITSPGSPISKPNGTYPIRIKNAVGTVAELGLTPNALKQKYKIKYVSGTMTVGGSRYCIQCQMGFFSGTELEFTAEVIFDGVTIANFTHNTADIPEYKTISDDTGRPASLDPIPPVNDFGNVVGSGIGLNIGPGHHLLEITVNSDWTGDDSAVGGVLLVKCDGDGNPLESWGVGVMIVDSTTNVYNSDFTAT